jgi:hypothetical protein
MKIRVLAAVGLLVTLAACGRSAAPVTGFKPSLVRAQSIQADWQTQILVNGEPAADYMSARVNDTWTFSVEAAHIEQIRWESDARISGAPNQATIRVSFPRGPNMYVVRCKLRSQSGQTAEHRIGVLMPAPGPSFPPNNPLPPAPFPPRP